MISLEDLWYITLPELLLPLAAHVWKSPGQYKGTFQSIQCFLKIWLKYEQFMDDGQAMKLPVIVIAHMTLRVRGT